MRESHPPPKDLGHEMFERAVSHEFDNLDATEKAGMEAALNRCRVLAGQIESLLRNKRPEHLLDKALLADLCASLEHAVDVLQKKSEPPVDGPPAPAVIGSQGRRRR
jgi:hypothetical protein